MRLPVEFCNVASRRFLRPFNKFFDFFFCGDGKLNYKREGIFEIYYSAKITKTFWLTADYQRINNPCFNADRGPVNVYSVRVHFEY